MLNAIIYCRVSTEEQAEDGHHSMSAQENLCRKAAQEKGYQVAAVFRDPGRTATNMNRPGLQDALSRCQGDRSIKAFLVQDTDRLARNTKDHLTIRAMLQKYEVKLISASQPMLEDSAEGNMIDTIIASVNQFQSDITKRKTLKGMEEKVCNGGWPGKAPLGYMNVGSGPDGSTRVVVPDPVTAPFVQELFKLYATGGYSLVTLADYMYGRGLRSFTGRRVKESKLHLMLQNEFYVGTVKWGGIETVGQHRPLVDRAAFQTVGTILHSHGGGFSRKRKHDFLLRGYLVCATCGHQLIGESHVSKRAAYYRCHTRNCERPVRMDDTERAVEGEFGKIALPPSILDNALQALHEQVESDRSTVRTRRDILQKQRKALVQKRDNLETKWMSGVVDDDDYRRLNGDLREQIQTLEIGLLQLDSRQQTDVDSIAEVVAFTRLIDVSYVKAPPHVKRLLLRFAFERFDMQGGKIIRAVPSKFMGALSGARQIARIAHEPVLVERAPVSAGDQHASQASMGISCVRLRGSWGPKPARNRPQIGREVSEVGLNTTTHRLIKLLEVQGYANYLLNLVQEIQKELRATQTELASFRRAA